ncbi:tetratricopeptide repeat protein [Caballeronia mineralivorans]|uniref:tetratricopeptide repeat protein n=1 Tax=Caballeronia mineralivorans TaxID=2010198 RepID=UPI00069EDD7E|nr:tetratricopeptide repeat protein [Caballeronia mineralivorans]
MKPLFAHHHYNPDWLSDDDLLANFVARQSDFSFLRDELARMPLIGSVQHYLLVGVRGSGKTTLLKRLAVAIRRDTDLQDHLIALSFPEELYQVKSLADFWWAACESLSDELDQLELVDESDRLITAIDKTKNARIDTDSQSDAGLKLLLDTCEYLKRRPVLLVDNLDMVFQRIDKTGRKLKNPHSPAYWAMREALSTTVSPIVIGGSVRLSEPFTDYDKAFYDFFLPKRLGKIDLDQVRRVLERLADVHGVPNVKQRLQARPSRIEALFELTGGNLRALGLIFELLRQGPNGRAIEDFERLMDITTPYYKARFEDLSEQAQVVMHALAVRRPGEGGLRFGHTAAEIGAHAGLPTGTISAQLDILEREGLVEKSAAHGRTQYRIAEQLFRLWLQLRGTRRIRQNVIGLAEFLEAMFDLDELQATLQDNSDTSALADAQFAFAVADTQYAAPLRQELEAHGTDLLFQHVEAQDGNVDDYLSSGDIPEDLEAVVHMRDQLRRCDGAGLTNEYQEAILGSIELHLNQKQASVKALCASDTAPEEAARLCLLLDGERRRLQRYGLHEADMALLFRQRARGKLSLPSLTPREAEATCVTVKDKAAFRAMVWRLVGAWSLVKFSSDDAAKDWLNWGLKYAGNANSTEWANVAGAMRRSNRWSRAKQVLDHAISIGTSSRTWYEQGAFERFNGNLKEAEASLRKAIELDPTDGCPWNGLGILLASTLKRFEEAEAAYRKAIELDPTYAWPWANLGNLLADELKRFEEAEAAYRKAIELDPANARPWLNLGRLLANKVKRFGEAEAAYRKAIELDPAYAWTWNNLGALLASKLKRFEEAEAAYRKAIELDPTYGLPWANLGSLLADELKRFEEAEAAYRKAIELDPANARPWANLGRLLANKVKRFEEAEAAYRKAIELDPTYAWPWNNLGNLLANRLKRFEEAEAAYRKAIELDPAYAWSWNNLGALLASKLKRFEEAEAAYRKAIELDPTYGLPWANLGNLLANELKRFEEAEAAYRKAIELDPAYARPWANLGRLLANKVKRFEEAEAAYRKAIELDPTYAWPWANLGNLLADELKRFEEAEAAYRKAIELDPANARPWLNLGRLLANKVKRLEEAEAAYRKAIELDPENAVPWVNLGGLMEKQNREDEASIAYARGAELDVEFSSYFRGFRVNLQTRRCVNEIKNLLKSGDMGTVRGAHVRLPVDSIDIAAALVSKQFIEDFLVLMLADSRQATEVLNAMRDLGYDKHARPLLLAFEAAKDDRPEMLDELEPEIQGAAKRMFERLKCPNGFKNKKQG